MHAWEPTLPEPARPNGRSASEAATADATPGDVPAVSPLCPPYTPVDHVTWGHLYESMERLWERYADECFLEGLALLHLPASRVPRVDEVRTFLAVHSGLQPLAARHRLPVGPFFESVRNRVLPISVSVRPPNLLDDPPEPDVFHDIAGRVPLFTDACFTQTFLTLARCAHTAADLVRVVPDPEERRLRLSPILKALLRFYWFTFEFGLVHYGNCVRAYGATLLSSAAEIVPAIDSSCIQRCDIHLEWLINQSLEVSRPHPLLFVVDNFDQLLELAATLEKWMLDGRLDRTASGTPELSAADLDSFFAV